MFRKLKKNYAALVVVAEGATSNCINVVSNVFQFKELLWCAGLCNL